MEAIAQKKSVWNFILFFIYIHLARCQVTLKHNSASALANTFICGTNTKFTCMIDPAPGLMSWVKDSASLTTCEGATDSCDDAIVDNYQFTSNVAVKEFYLTVNSVILSNAGTFTCSNGASVDDSKTISIAAVPSAITMTESGTGTITLQATTDCAFPMSDVSIEWYYLKELTDTPQLYTDNGFSPVRTGDSSTCTSGNCTSGVGVSKVVSTVEFDEKGIGGTSAYLQAKMVHKAAPSSDPAVVATTTKKFIIIEAPPEEIYDCPGLGNSTYVDSDGECVGAWFGICLCSFILTLISFGLILGYILIKYAKHYCCDECCEECLECCCCWCCSACCFIATLSAWYQILWVSVVLTPVAIGIWVVLKCLKIIEPEKPVITKKFSPNATSICVEWMKSNVGGSQILFYRITILRVTVKGNTEIEEVVEVKKINNILSTSCTFTELSPGTTYKVKVCAHNVMFRSLPGQEVIHTKNAEKPEEPGQTNKSGDGTADSQL